MKDFILYFRTCWIVLLTVLTAAGAQADNDAAGRMDSVEIGLITCTPHNEIYSLYGHTALRCHDLRTKEDLVFNYGVFNFNAPHFVARFVLGKTDYELGVAELGPFCKYYRSWGSMVVEQVLNLTNEEKQRIIHALNVNLMPQNRIYRYNFFYDNCSTRPRDIIENNLLGKVIYEPREDYTPSYRDMIHEQTEGHPWTAMGNDLLLGLKADQATDRRQQEFLPLNLMYDFDHAQILANGEYRPLVKERRVLVEAGVQAVEGDGLLTPTVGALLLLIGCLGTLFYEERRKRRCHWLDIGLMTATGLAGWLLFIMIFSEHPTTSLNLQILVLNPLWTLFIPSMVRHKPTRYWTVLLVCIALFFAGGLLQDYAEGMYILALCLLTRYYSHFRYDK